MAKKRATAARRMISLPADLDARMSKHTEVNWSKVATDAFEMKLGQLNIQKGSKAMSDVIQRLRASKLEQTSQEHTEGVQEGRDWATRYADFPELQRLSAWWDRSSEDDREATFTTGDTDAFGSGAYIATIITGEDRPNRALVDEFWDQALGDDDNRRFNDGFVRGFVDGALSVWEEVKDQV